MSQALQLDVAIVGGGASGTYSAWRLQEALGNNKRIALFEYGDRIGGRLFSINLPGLPNVVAEVGGMRYMPSADHDTSGHVLVDKLVQHLDLPSKDFPMGNEQPKDHPVGAQNNLFYLRGQRFRMRDFTEAPDKIPYNLAWSERGFGPEDLQVKVMNSIYPGFDQLSLPQQMQVQVFGKEIWRYGFWDLLYRVLSNEGYQFMKDAGGYEANVANANAVTQLPATEYSDTTQFLTLKKGFQSLPLTLAETFAKLPGVLRQEQRVQMNQRLVSVDYSDDQEYPYRLHFQRTRTVNGSTTDVDEPQTAVQARQVILAMPRRALELVESPLFNDAWLKHNLGSVLVQSAFKLFLAYEQPWWRALGLVAGRSVTDLPVRQVYYMGTECEQEHGEPTLNSLLMASYNDIGTVPFWKGLEGGEDFQGYAPNNLKGAYGINEVVPRTQFQVSDEMVRIAQRQVTQVHDQVELPAPYSAVYHAWDADPYGGGWHEWKANYRLDLIIHKMRHPVDDQAIYIVGEAYSYGQGWVEGALTVAESTLQDFFKLSRPSWLPEQYQLLPDQGPAEIEPPTPMACKDCAKTLEQVTEFAYTGIQP
ncbi:flavin monoamine oxidase family protein [Pseudomonas fontis]|uniref:Tryptophan 2-monooxygenase n=1 Tax=Pseudomonas fontis TaxID=2942633 RepID=A0ABT5NYV7_9PSED|nr:FAD-dependent oxidoreductase [Pseudomonas fontis]MDD0974005.1 FAD-dependent oxidoreductase [Pseudomonas fontis]MDD0993371.1 FAD-dependent oxidoreductase [Pseudomonas fontis]